MESSTVAALVRYFNIASITVMAIFAFFGVVAIFRKIVFRPKALSGKSAKRQSGKGAAAKNSRVLLPAFCVAALAAFALEVTAFNFPHYLKYFAGPQTTIIGMSETEQNVLTTSDGTLAELIEGGIRFSGLNRKITSVYVNIDFVGTVETVDMTVRWTDESSTYQYTKKLYKYLPHENYAPLQPCGDVLEIIITFDVDGSKIQLSDVVINKPVPFYFSGLRLWVVSLLFFALFVLLNKGLRVKAAYYLFEYKFDSDNKKQNIVYACTVAALILFSWICVYTSVSDDFKNLPRWHQYNKFLVDALIDGRTYLDSRNLDTLLNGAERPYDWKWRAANGLNETVNEGASDWAWHKGKFYCYYGVVPAVLLYVPYKLITGNYLSNHAGVFLFAAIAVVLLALLWRRLVRRYMRDTRYALYLLSFVALFFSVGIYGVLRFPLFYCIVQSAGFMFAVAGFLLLLISIKGDKVSLLPLFFACLCFALIFGCRPNAGFASLLVPVVLWKYRSWKLFLFVMIPYILVAIPLCVYNYVRFESIFNFGQDYCLTEINAMGYFKQNPLGKIFKMFVNYVFYLFYPNSLSPYFPFVNTGLGCFNYTQRMMTLGIYRPYFRGCAIINFPVVFCLFYLFKHIFDKNKPKIFFLLYSSLIIAAVIITFNSYVVGFAGRFMLDMSAFIIIPSLFCAYYWCSPDTASTTLSVSPAVRLKVTYVLIAASIFVGLFLFVNGTDYMYNDPALYRYLERSLGIFRHV